jgi:pilus assembly protein FimV
MKRQVFFAGAIAAVLGVGAAAQEPQSGSASASSTQPGSAQIVTVTGCVQAGEQSASAAGAPSAAPSFVLANPTMGSAGSSGTPGAAGTSGTASPSTTAPATTPPSTTSPAPTEPPASPSTAPQSAQAGAGAAGAVGTSGTSAGIKLSGQPDTLKGLENQRVEIRGTFQGDSAGAASSSSSSAMRTLRITSIRPLPGDCGAVK